MSEIISEQIQDLLDALDFRLSTIKPSEWAEQHRIMGSGESRFRGKFNYDITPYCKEIVDCMSADNPARIISVMKGAQIGFSTGVIEPAIGWTIAENPGNILFLTGHADLADEAVNKLDLMIDSCGIRHLIRPQAARAKSMKTGDTNSKKEFPGGSLVSGSAGNHKLLRQRSIKVAFIDDFDAARNSTNESGSTRKMIEQRLAAYYDEMKLYYISTPELKDTSNIEPVYLLGDQRKYNVPCPCCGDFIDLQWNIQIDEKEAAGITWQVDNGGRLIENSVGYICQSCSGFFTDKGKYEMNLNGVWKPTATPFMDGYRSYHLSSLYAPLGMKDWKGYVYDYLEACPQNAPIVEPLYKTFVNLCLGETYESKSKELNSANLQVNIRGYDILQIPEKLSINDGNGRIVLVTLAADLNGVVEDARLDYEIVGWSEKGASYSIVHGSIGTFIPREGAMAIKAVREKWTYEHGKSLSVWNELEKILNTVIFTDTGRQMKVFICGIDTGHYTQHAYEYIDGNRPCFVYGLKGKDENKYTRFGVDIPSFTHAKERNKLYLINVNKVKDTLANCMELKWDGNNGELQPDMFMNFPTPSDGKYLYTNYFSHFEAEERVSQTTNGQSVGSCWRKKGSHVQNHFWDVRVYGLVLRDILVDMVGRELKIPKATWSDYINAIFPKA